MGALTNIDRDGFGSAAFHANPDQMRFDAITGDYGMGLFGHAYATASYLVEHPIFGWLGFGGTVSPSNDSVRIEPKDSGRSRLFIAPAGVWLTLQAGKIESATYSPTSGVLTLQLAAADDYTRNARLLIETTTPSGRSYAPQDIDSLEIQLERGLYTIPLADEPTVLTLAPLSPTATRACEPAMLRGCAIARTQDKWRDQRDSNRGIARSSSPAS
jgi:hypothetical protein